MKHLDGCTPKWRISCCEACQNAINCHEELVQTLKLLAHGLDGQDREDVLALIAKAEGK